MWKSAARFIYHWISEETISDITPGTLGGELILSDGKSFNLSDNNLPENAVRAFVIDSKGINYQIPANKPQVKEIQNILRTLQGMECLITLSDGTRVHLNAETPRKTSQVKTWRNSSYARRWQPRARFV